MLDSWSNHYILSTYFGRCRMVQTLEQILGVPLSDEQPKLTPWVHGSHPWLLPFPPSSILWPDTKSFAMFSCSHWLNGLKNLKWSANRSLPLLLTWHWLETKRPRYSACCGFRTRRASSLAALTVAMFTNALQILKQPSRNAQQKRQVFVDFFCRPGRLEDEVKELVSRVRGLPE